MSNGIYEQMMSAYDTSTEQQRRNAVYEVNQQSFLPGFIMAVFLTMLLFMEALV